MAMFNMGKVIQNKRKEKNLTQEELAKEMGVSKSSVSKWETGQTYPDIYLLPELATFFNISIDYLMGYEPQLTKEQIKDIYVELSKRFGSEDFEVVFKDYEELVKKYYSSISFILQMATLLLNYANFAFESRQTEILHYIITLTQRVKQESKEPFPIIQANTLEAYCYLQLQEFDKTLELLNHDVTPYMGAEQLLSGAYAAKGDIQKAQEVTQVAQFQHLMGNIFTCSNALLYEVGNLDKFNEIVTRGTALIELYQLRQLHPAPVITFLNNVFVGYTQQFRLEEALVILDDIVSLMLQLEFPLEIHGDEYFNLLDNWISRQLDFNTSMPRDEKTIKASLVSFYETHPAMISVYSDNQTFKELVKKLKENIGDN